MYRKQRNRKRCQHNKSERLFMLYIAKAKQASDCFSPGLNKLETQYQGFDFEKKEKETSASSSIQWH